jgi:hypothetical protein
MPTKRARVEEKTALIPITAQQPEFCPSSAARKVPIEWDYPFQASAIVF